MKPAMPRVGKHAEPVTVAELLKRLDEIDRQYVTKSDNWWAGAALTVRMLAEHAEGSLRDSEIFKDWEAK